jgi:hypothetical protein
MDNTNISLLERVQNLTIELFNDKYSIIWGKFIKLNKLY